MNSWIETHNETDEDAGRQEITEVLELPHGSLVRTKVIQRHEGILFDAAPTVAVALAFVPNLKPEIHADTVELVFKH